MIFTPEQLAEMEKEARKAYDQLLGSKQWGSFWMGYLTYAEAQAKSMAQLRSITEALAKHKPVSSVKFEGNDDGNRY